MPTDTLKKVEQDILKIISRSRIPEDYLHARNVREWVLRLKPGADFALRIAALAHDIERAFPGRKIRRGDYGDYDSFKKAHARNSARIISEILDGYPLTAEMKNKIAYLVEGHELSEDHDQNLSTLKDADGISFFEVNLPFYFQRNTEEETLFRMRWGYRRLSSSAREIVKKFKYQNEKLNSLFKKCISS